MAAKIIIIYTMLNKSNDVVYIMCKLPLSNVKSPIGCNVAYY